MKKRIGWVITGFIVVALVGVYFLLPRLVTAVPAQYHTYIPDPLLHQVATPLPTALPAATAVSLAPVEIPTIVVSPQLSVDTPEPLAETRVPSVDPTVTPSLSHYLAPSPVPFTRSPLPSMAHITNISIIPQKFNNCGPANLTITLDFYGHTVDQLDVGGKIKPNYDDRNVSPWELVDYVNESTPLQADYFVGGDINLLKRLLAAGFPVIIEKGLYTSEWEGWMGHYLTMVGYNDTAQEFISLDTFLGPWDGNGRIDPYNTIAEFWFQFNSTFILVYPPEQADTINEIVGETMLNPLFMWQQAAQTAKTTTINDPKNAYAWFNLGTNLTEMGILTGDIAFYENAAAAFDQARAIGLPWRMLWYQFNPYIAYLEVGRPDDVLTLTSATLTSTGGQNVEETYLYQGYGLQATNDSAGAEAAFNRARQLNHHLLIHNQDS
ncbi:MAG: hypothetical protein GY943_26560 [Chloroflexi bacterium]|nr:hypothetical protein [Chloroflexota bacterium]